LVFGLNHDSLVELLQKLYLLVCLVKHKLLNQFACMNVDESHWDFVFSYLVQK
jgi:hypothetical protein